MRTSTPSLGACARGSVFPEYVVLLVLVSLGCVSAMVALGPPLLKLYLTQRAVLLVPYPL